MRCGGSAGSSQLRDASAHPTCAKKIFADSCAFSSRQATYRTPPLKKHFGWNSSNASGACLSLCRQKQPSLSNPYTTRSGRIVFSFALANTARLPTGGLRR